MDESQPGGGLRPSDENLVAGLVELGLAPNAASAYVALLRLGVSGATEIAGDADIPRTKVYATLQGLEDSGFVLALPGHPTRWRAVEAGPALDEWVRRREQHRRAEARRDERLHQTLVAHLPVPPDQRAPVTNSSVMQAIHGRDAALASVNELISASERQLDLVYTEAGPQDPSEWNRRECEAIRRGVAVRLLCTPEAASDPQRYRAILEAGGDARITHGLSFKLALRDRTEALVGVRVPESETTTTVRVHHPDLLAPLQLMFQKEWRDAESLA